MAKGWKRVEEMQENGGRKKECAGCGKKGWTKKGGLGLEKRVEQEWQERRNKRVQDVENVLKKREK